MIQTHSANSTQRAVLVTGCSSGIGYATALRLARQGYITFATVRKEKDAEALRALGEPDLIPICPLDLTRLEDIRIAGKFVRAELAHRKIKGLYALVNNAGAGGIAPIELIDLDSFRTELETRLLGPVALLQTLLPLIREAHGRLVWIVTPAIIPISYVAGIHAPDFAVNCLARTLALELRPWGIPSVMIRCGGVQTAAVQRSEQEFTASLSRWPLDRVALYRESLLAAQRELAEFDLKRIAPDKVAQTVQSALDARKPKPRYRIGHLAGMAALLELLPQGMADTIMAMRG